MLTAHFKLNNDIQLTGGSTSMSSKDDGVAGGDKESSSPRLQLP